MTLSSAIKEYLMLSFMTPALSRRSTSKAGSKLIIPIPNHNQWLHLPILIYCLIGWTFGELATVNELNRLSPNNNGDGFGDGFFLTWAILWTAGGVCALLDLLWQLWGHQTLTVDSTYLTRRHSLLGLGWIRHYRLTQIRNVRVVSQPESGRYSSIAFDYEAQTIRLGPDMDEMEAKQIVGIIQKYISI